MKVKKIILFFSLWVANGLAFSQNNNLDSLQNLLMTVQQDTLKHTILMEIGNQQQKSNPDSALFYHTQSFELAKKISPPEGELLQAASLRNKGWDYALKGDYNKALNLFDKSIKITEKYIQNNDLEIVKKAIKIQAGCYSQIGICYFNLGNPKKALAYTNKSLSQNRRTQNKIGQAANFGNLGIFYAEQGEYPKALSNFYSSLKINEEINDKKCQADNLANIGSTYADIGENKKALFYFSKAQKIDKLINNKAGEASNLGNIGSIYNDMGDDNKALEFFFKALSIYNEIGNKNGQSSNLANIGNTYSNLGNLSKALEYSQKSLKISEEIGSMGNIAFNNSTLGVVYAKLKQHALAEHYLKRAEELNHDLGSIVRLKSDYKGLAELYEQTEKHKLALSYYKKFVQLEDSIKSEDNYKAGLQQEIKYEYEKQAAIDSIANAKELEIKEIEIAKQQTEIKAKRNQQYALYSGLALVLIFSAVMYNRYRVTKKQKHIIEIQKSETEKQKLLVEEKNKEISDSIIYAKRIQEAILPSRYSLTEHLKNGFVLYKPKDIVSGDFYWLEKYNESIYFAAADCTGHGVPGAMVSVVCANALSKALLEENQTETGELLDRTRELVVERFTKNDENVKDGMDISLCRISNNQLQWSGANNPLWIIRKNSNEVEEIKGNKQPIGKSDSSQPFTSHEVELTTGDTIYIFTDGFADQFGGEKGKKFMYKQLKELFLAINHLKMDEQREKLNQAFINWQGSQEQVDDVCIIGVRV
ncbi:MAG: tetratricopeptide repeat protein [Flavobacteriales bacterium]|nr:tetratricopeptide repeat protein [Flavobacteriales bacterium]